ncbi:hypothetical protein SAMN00768000_3089 [Sulfobacillus thermosulfidooxidans DSM 9293]|uniref:Uncharacterized protein n=2 Tax=Sulfobacillus thermosulfidooxidans TaxID=28034 RepID=A0A1W1WKR4_SULTA|nr:hypothetical protein [Sulfobacillus thermosulfidooxidans]PSR21708.1 MAG: hypothetical protein C7B47_17140 [Sulfobacillus thermosulfidooxidans]SMC06901.1 hypothetical protein SAMN00768000_3089 [Sulfobacillus thermosulfidooxidans DSM 9293]
MKLRTAGFLMGAIGVLLAGGSALAASLPPGQTLQEQLSYQNPWWGGLPPTAAVQAVPTTIWKQLPLVDRQAITNFGGGTPWQPVQNAQGIWNPFDMGADPGVIVPTVNQHQPLGFLFENANGHMIFGEVPYKDVEVMNLGSRGYYEFMSPWAVRHIFGEHYTTTPMFTNVLVFTIPPTGHIGSGPQLYAYSQLGFPFSNPQ